MTPSPSSEDTPFQIAPATQTLISTESVWKYLDNGRNQGTAWRGRTFNDNRWDQGRAELGYGDGDETTEVGFWRGPGQQICHDIFSTPF